MVSVPKAQSLPTVRQAKHPQDSLPRSFRLHTSLENHHRQANDGTPKPASCSPPPPTSSSDPVDGYIQIGIYGWRKRCLCVIILILTILVAFNTTLTIWLCWTLKVDLGNIGNLHMTSDGIAVNGKLLITDRLYVKQLQSEKAGEAIKVLNDDGIVFAIKKSGKQEESNHSVEEGDEYFKMGPQSIEIVTNHLFIKSLQEQPVFAIENDQLSLQLKSLKIINNQGVRFDSSVQSPLFLSEPRQDLLIQSRTRQVRIMGTQGVGIESGGEMDLSGHKNVQLNSNNGSIDIDADSIMMKNLKIASPIISNTPELAVYQVCLCSANGRLFMAKSNGLCSYDVKVCGFAGNSKEKVETLNISTRETS
ncbi:gamma-sarcoglycan-like isoform X2 [Brevipalpus obovatus]|uniref:gamma-sarcoglycan-like isoform X2 n=1 Tax=Brevipalpus obovatus TaxID=246614 RepID=UPI003D9EE432